MFDYSDGRSIPAPLHHALQAADLIRFAVVRDLHEDLLAGRRCATPGPAAFLLLLVAIRSGTIDVRPTSKHLAAWLWTRCASLPGLAEVQTAETVTSRYRYGLHAL